MQIDSPVRIGWIQLTMTSTTLMALLVFADALPPQQNPEYDFPGVLGMLFCLVNIIAQWQMFFAVRRLQAAAAIAVEAGDDVAAG